MYIQCMNDPNSKASALPPGVGATEGDFVKLASDDFDVLVMQTRASSKRAIR